MRDLKNKGAITNAKNLGKGVGEGVIGLGDMGMGLTEGIAENAVDNI